MSGFFQDIVQVMHLIDLENMATQVSVITMSGEPDDSFGETFAITRDLFPDAFHVLFPLQCICVIR
jgi:hypothetical protein